MSKLQKIFGNLHGCFKTKNNKKKHLKIGNLQFLRINHNQNYQKLTRSSMKVFKTLGNQCFIYHYVGVS